MEGLTALEPRGSSPLAVIEVPEWHGSAPAVLPEQVEQAEEGADRDWQVVVYNNEINTYIEVISILMIATACDAEEAYIEAWEIDHYGQCSVHRASQCECERAAEIISTIGIRVEACPDPLS